MGFFDTVYIKLYLVMVERTRTE